MTLPTPPGVFVDYGSVAIAAGSTNDWGSVSAAAMIFEDWEAAVTTGAITSTNQIPKPIDKLWAFIGRIDRREDEER